MLSSWDVVRTFQRFVAQIRYSHPWKVLRKRIRRGYPSQTYSPHTKILEVLTTEEIRIFEALFRGVGTQFGQRVMEKCFENPHFVCCSSFQNLRLGWINFGRMNKRRTADVRSTFTWLVAQIEYSRTWKVLRTSFRRLFLHPKSSFGMGKSDSESHGDDSMTMCLTVLHCRSKSNDNDSMTMCRSKIGLDITRWW